MKLSARDHLAPEVASVSDLQSKARPDQKKVMDKAETTDSETEAAHCLDVCNTNADFTLKQDQGALDIGGKWRNGCFWNSSIQKPEDLTNQDGVLDLSSGILHLSGDSLLPKSISKKCLAECKALQQVDRKFIPVVGGGILAIIDQHAADERIRLEDLREKVLSGETKTITYLDAEQELFLPEIGNLNFLHNQPSVAALIAVPCILGVNLTDADLLEFLQQLADTDGSSLIPPAVLRVLNSKACRAGNVNLYITLVVALEELFGRCNLLAHDPIQKTLAMSTIDGRIKLFGQDNTQAVMESPEEVPSKFLQFIHNQPFLININAKDHIEVWDIEKKSLAHGHVYKGEITSFTVLQRTFYMYVGDSFGNVSVLKFNKESCNLVQMNYRIPFSASHGNSTEDTSDAAVMYMLPQPTAESKRILIIYRNGFLRVGLVLLEAK
nr:DNA mismatch repair protein MLH3 isoform X1 [Tanacetum cinerariifolium]